MQYINEKDRSVEATEKLLKLIEKRKITISRLKRLIQFNPNLDVKTTYGESAIISSALDNKLEELMFLVENGADINITDSRGHTAIMIATQENLKDMVQYLISKNANLEIQSYSRNYTMLMMAAQKNHSEIAQMAINANANIYTQYEEGKADTNNAYSIAKESKNWEITTIIKEKELSNIKKIINKNPNLANIVYNELTQKTHS